MAEDAEPPRLAAALAAVSRIRSRDALPQEVSPGLYIGSVGAARNLEALKAAGITAVVCATSEAAPYFPETLKYLHIKVRDEAGVRISKHFDDSFAFIERGLFGGGAVLVHCVVGRSRSGTLVAAYLMRKYGLTMGAALEQIRRVRPQVAPNPSFAIQLLRLEKTLREAREGGLASDPAEGEGEEEEGEGEEEGEDGEEGKEGDELRRLERIMREVRATEDEATPEPAEFTALTTWGVVKLVFTVTPVVITFGLALPSIAFLPPLPTYAYVMEAMESGRFPLRETVFTLVATGLVMGAGSLAVQVVQKGLRARG
ncbi:protein-tyrosine phosphatase-like protein [Pavlovales sp. CCMP2436]|nr:protein-tyrosine phosphatase-like protein [Pavlovales sp. CCMP2436]